MVQSGSKEQTKNKHLISAKPRVTPANKWQWHLTVQMTDSVLIWQQGGQGRERAF
jgi:hypothetical protein